MFSLPNTKQKEQVAHGKSREREIAAALKAYELKVHPSGETHKLYRIKVVTDFMTAGVPLSKVECFRPILEENAYRLCERRGLSFYSSFGPQQDTSLNDYIEFSIMLQYNNRKFFNHHYFFHCNHYHISFHYNPAQFEHNR